VRDLTLDDPVQLAVSRWTHLIVDDDYPPVQWLTRQYAMRVPKKWVKLVECPWCVSPYIGAWITAWLCASQWDWLLVGLREFAWTSWWFVNGVASLSQVAAMVNLRDVPEDQREVHVSIVPEEGER
jgi:hypothetical protein